ncbi:MAG: NAD(P)-dependent oxidoreductase [Anaerolineae bacterium]|nr:NAD(P)-dependent oxidoreductase [Anaerolineae bacterium]
MSTILITGASGLIGRALAARLAEHHAVVCISRHDPELNLPWIRGDFSAFEDLRKLDSYEIDAVIHLAAVTGGCLERDGILVNVEGTRCLMRYLMDRGCQKFVMASSIAAVGLQSTQFLPLQLPIPDEHPCLDRDGYGFSKYLMEEITRYYQRQDETLDVINLRLSGASADDRLAPPAAMQPLRPWSLAGITQMNLTNALEVFTRAVEAPYKPGMRVINATARNAWVANPMADILKNWWGEHVDVRYFEQPGHEYASAFDVTRLRDELGLVIEQT